MLNLLYNIYRMGQQNCLCYSVTKLAKNSNLPDLPRINPDQPTNLHIPSRAEGENCSAFMLRLHYQKVGTIVHHTFRFFCYKPIKKHVFFPFQFIFMHIKVCVCYATKKCEWKSTGVYILLQGNTYIWSSKDICTKLYKCFLHMIFSIYGITLKKEKNSKCS